MSRKFRRKKSKHNKIIILSIALLSLFTVGYAAFSTNLNIKSKGNIQERNNLYVSSTGNDTTGNGTINKPFKTVQKAYNSAWDNATIYIMDNITVDETINFDEEKNIILTSENNEINSLLRGKENEKVLSITSGKVTLTNITLDGQNKDANDSLLYATRATVNLNEGTTIQNNVNHVDRGGGIFLSLNGVMNINGAKIINNQALAGGGGAIIARHATLTINSGELSGNTAINGGAIFFGDLEGILTLNGGTITNNNTTTACGGGIRLSGANMVMNGGKITYNNALSANGGGVCVTSVTNYDNISTFTIKNGIISNNTAVSGGGVYVFAGHTYNYIGGTITNNTPDNVYQN